MHQPEFMHINSQPVRVTSLKQAEGSNDLLVVIISRGTSGASFLQSVANLHQVELDIPDGPSGTYLVQAADLRTTGEEERVMVRAQFTFAKTDQVEEVESQLDRIERKLEEILRLLNESGT